MQTRFRHLLLLGALIMLAPFLSACGLAQSATSTTAPPPQANAGEAEGTIPSSAAEAPAVSPASSPQDALERFASQYVNWSYATLAQRERQLAAESIGEARAFEEQALAQTVRDTSLRRGHIYNTGTVIAIARVRGGSPDEWVIDTREQTGGDQEYAGLQASFHITLATVARVGQAYVVSSWHPEV